MCVRPHRRFIISTLNQMESPNFFKEVLFVVVLHERSLTSSPAFNTIKKLEEKFPGNISVFVYDNSSSKNENPFSFVTMTHDPSNPGVSKAYNEAAKFAHKNSFKYLLLMDQDSVFPEFLFEEYEKSVQNNKTTSVFVPVMKDSRGIISPFSMHLGKGRRLSNVFPRRYSFAELKVINSGMLITTELFLQAGGYDERFPLDYSDIVFCDKLAKAGEHFFVLPIEVEHELSSESPASKNVKDKRFKKFEEAFRLYQKISEQQTSWILTVLPRKLRLAFSNLKSDK